MSLWLHDLTGIVSSGQELSVCGSLFVTEVGPFEDLCAGLAQPCACSGRWILHSIKQVNIEGQNHTAGSATT